MERAGVTQTQTPAAKREHRLSERCVADSARGTTGIFVVTYKHSTSRSRHAMPVTTTFSSRDFTRDVSAAKRAAADGPVFVTDRGRPAYALLTIEDYYRLSGQKNASLLDIMDAIPGSEGIEFEPPTLQIVLQPADLA
jgi:PHD/YefM family antitoxin component YafN of YafNO toxin-antitoxin module